MYIVVSAYPTSSPSGQQQAEGVEVGYADWKLDLQQTEVRYAADRGTGSWICSGQKLDMQQTV